MPHLFPPLLTRRHVRSIRRRISRTSDLSGLPPTIPSPLSRPLYLRPLCILRESAAFLWVIVSLFDLEPRLVLGFGLTWFPPTAESPVHRFSRSTFEAHDAHRLSHSSSLDGLEIPEDSSLLMDQSPLPPPMGSPIPPFQDFLSRVRTRREDNQEDHVSPPAGDLEILSAVQSGRLESSLSMGRIADFLGDICAFQFVHDLAYFSLVSMHRGSTCLRVFDQGAFRGKSRRESVHSRNYVFRECYLHPRGYVVSDGSSYP